MHFSMVFNVPKKGRNRGLCYEAIRSLLLLRFRVWQVGD